MSFHYNPTYFINCFTAQIKRNNFCVWTDVKVESVSTWLVGHLPSWIIYQAHYHSFQSAASVTFIHLWLTAPCAHTAGCVRGEGREPSMKRSSSEAKHLSLTKRSARGVPGYYLDIIWILSGYYLDIIWILSGYYLDIIWILSGYYLDTIWILSGFWLKDTEAGQQRPSFVRR